MFPFSPHSATKLAVGDLIAVPTLTGKWTCLQVLELEPRARTTFVVGRLPWVGSGRPTAEAVAGLAPLERALTRIEIFTHGQLEVVGNVEPSISDQPSFYGTYGVGTVSRVWGWQAAIRIAQSLDEGLDEAAAR